VAVENPHGQMVVLLEGKKLYSQFLGTQTRGEVADSSSSSDSERAESSGTITTDPESLSAQACGTSVRCVVKPRACHHGTHRRMPPLPVHVCIIFYNHRKIICMFFSWKIFHVKSSFVFLLFYSHGNYMHVIFMRFFPLNVQSPVLSLENFPCKLQFCVLSLELRPFLCIFMEVLTQPGFSM